jgi:acid phosphatase family membrane protein YuiD
MMLTLYVACACRLQASQLAEVFNNLAKQVQSGAVPVSQAQGDLDFASAAVQKAKGGAWHAAAVGKALGAATKAVNKQKLAARVRR